MDSQADFGTGVDQSVEPSKVTTERAVPLPVKAAKAVLWLSAWAVTIWWSALWFRLSSVEGKKFRSQVQLATASNFWGKYSTSYVMYVVPVIGLAIIALLYLELEERFPTRVRCSSFEQSRLVRLYRAIWTQPLLVKTPIGIISVIDIVIIVIVFVCSMWIWIDLLRPSLARVDAEESEDGEPKWALKWEKACDYSGRSLFYLIAILFIPVARGSPILRLINLPFEQAIKYHRWIGYFTVLISFLHGATYGVYAGAIQKLELLIEWPHRGTNNCAGTIALVAGLAILITSIPWVRKYHFNTFFAVHQLYLIYFIFYVFHVDWNHTSASMGPIFLFFIDRFLRMVQSRRQVTGVTARVLPSGYVELRISKQPGFKYNTLSFLYLNVPGLKRLFWHPFSTSSSPLNDNNALSIHIKPLGDWTTGLYNEIEAKSGTDNKSGGCPFALKLYAEGPYGHESDYYLRYRNLILVAGGAGVTPFMAIIEDIMKRHSLGQEGLPTNVQLIWCMRGKAELDILSTVKPGQIYSSYGHQQYEPFKLSLQAYVTGKPPVGGVAETPAVEMSGAEIHALGGNESPQKGVPNRNGLSAVNSNQNLWMIALILATSIGFVLISALIFHYITDPRLLPKGKRFNSAIETLLHFVSLFVAIFICGGSVIFFWMSSAWLGSSTSTSSYTPESKELADLEGNDNSSLLDRCIVTEGCRPQFKELFNGFAEKHDGEEVGVLICGPEGLQESVASACRSQNFASLMKTPFHYHSVSFDL